MSDTATINLNELEAQIAQEVANMSEEQIREAVLKAKVRARVTQKKYYNPDRAREQRQKAAARVKYMENILRQKGLYEAVAAQAAEQADAELAELAASEE